MYLVTVNLFHFVWCSCVLAVTSQLSPKQTPAPPPPSPAVGNVQNITNLPDVLPSQPSQTAVEHEPQGQAQSRGTDPPHANSTSETEAPSAPTNSHDAPENNGTADVSNSHSPNEAVLEDNTPSSPSRSQSSGQPHTAADAQDLLKNLEVPDKIGPELLEEVRKSTRLSFEKSKIAVETVLGYVGFKVPALEGLMDRILTSLHFGVGHCLLL